MDVYNIAPLVRHDITQIEKLMLNAERFSCREDYTKALTTIEVALTLANKHQLYSLSGILVDQKSILETKLRGLHPL
ncbi:MAG TPA: hypothetical protein ENN30_01945 [Candidatus Woesearchaeota archaeon]|nr:hypothetical protein [Candidatus Woesearchaeota archaeon]